MSTTTPTVQQIQTTNIPEQLLPYASTLMQDVADYAASVPNYTPFQGQGLGGTQIAGFDPLQLQAMQGIQSMQTSPLLAQAAGQAGAAAANTGAIAGSYTPFEAGNQFSMPSLQSMGLGYLSAAAPSLSNYQMSGAGNISGAQGNAYQMAGPQNVYGAQGAAGQMAGPQQFTGSNVNQYMTPYLQTAQNQAIQNYANSLPQLGSVATSVGGLGGSREALVQAQAQQGLQQTLAGNVANAFQNAQQQFNTSQAQQLQTGQANLGAYMQAEQQNVGNVQAANLANQGYQYQTGAQNLSAAQQMGLANLSNAQQAALSNQQIQQQTQAANQAAQLGVQQLGAGQQLQANLANQQAGITTQGQALSQEQMLNQLGLTGAQSAAQYGLAGQQLNAQQAQFLSNLGLQANQQLLGASGQLGSLGQQSYAQQAGILQAQMGAGATQQQLMQNLYNTQYQNYLNSMNYTPALYSYESGILHGVSPASLGGSYATSVYQPTPSTGQLGAAALTTAAGIPGLFGSTTGP